MKLIESSKFHVYASIQGSVLVPAGGTNVVISVPALIEPAAAAVRRDNVRHRVRIVNSFTTQDAASLGALIFQGGLLGLLAAGPPPALVRTIYRSAPLRASSSLGLLYGATFDAEVDDDLTFVAADIANGQAVAGNFPDTGLYVEAQALISNNSATAYNVTGWNFTFEVIRQRFDEPDRGAE